MKYEYEELVDRLAEIQNSFDRQLDEINRQQVNFHERLIELMANYPQLRDIIQFILEVNDTIESKQKAQLTAHYDAVSKLIAAKKSLIRHLEKEAEKKPIIDFLKKINILGSPKYLFLVVLTIILSISLYFQPDQTLILVREFKELFKSVK